MQCSTTKGLDGVRTLGLGSLGSCPDGLKHFQSLLIIDKMHGKVRSGQDKTGQVKPGLVWSGRKVYGVCMYVCCLVKVR